MLVCLWSESSGADVHWLFGFFFFKQKTAYEMRISDWSSDVCSSDLIAVVSTDDGAVLAIGQRLVTRDGAMRRWDGFAARSGGAAAAERLLRVNRLAEIGRA